jgi:adenosylcobinamide kinase/adenosylcobinamide-phosphate guanylyltransferase
MKALFIGGIKSGKSKNAEEYAISHTKTKPYYLATTEFIDKDMKIRIQAHKQQRKDRFITIEEPINLTKKVSSCDDIVVVECMSMWLNNMLYHNFSDDEIFNEVDMLCSLDKDIVFVLNDVGSGIIPDNDLARKFCDLSGVISQKIASSCESVYHTIAGISTKIK